MFHKSSLIIFATFFLAINHASASEKMCKPLISISKYNQDPYPLKTKNLNSCLCGYELSELKVNSPDGFEKIEISPPEGFSLVAACDVREQGSNIDGTLFFNGEAILTGHITRINGDPGAWFYFKPNSQKSDGNRFNSSLNELKFSYDVKAFHAPSLTNEPSCWRATATIKIKTFTLILGDGNEAGTRPMKYEVMSVGKYLKCKLQQ